MNVCHVGGLAFVIVIPYFGLQDATSKAPLHINSIIFYITVGRQARGERLHAANKIPVDSEQVLLWLFSPENTLGS